MSNCRKFIHGVNAINFSADMAQDLRTSLIRLAHDELIIQHEALSKSLADLPDNIANNDFAKKQLADYKLKLKANIQKIEQQLTSISKKNPNINFNQKIAYPKPEKFINDFAANFRDIKHLAYTLSDAPPFIKSLRIHFYIRVLMDLTKAEQEAQLQALSLTTIKNTIVEAMVLYEQSSNDELRNECQKLVHMVFYELVRRTCDQYVAANDKEKYLQYLGLLRYLNTIIPPVYQSAIIDNLSAYRASDNRSIIDLLAEVEHKLSIDLAVDWHDDDKILVVQERKKLLHALRFGQEDRREYAKKIKDNLARDLFWARGIRDAEIFTSSILASDTYQGINVINYIKTNIETLNAPCPLRPEDLNAFDTPQEKRLATVIKRISDECDKESIPKKSFAVLSPDKNNPIKKTNQIARKAFKEFFEKANVTVNNKLITVELFHIADADALTKKMLDIGGFSFTPAGLLHGLKKIKDQIGTSGISLTGTSLAAIRQKLNARQDIPEKIREAYEAQLKNLENSIPKLTLKVQIKELHLDNNKELLLGKLLELYGSAYPTKNNEVLNKAYQLLDQGKIEETLNIAGIEETIKLIYESLAKENENNVPTFLKALVTKSKQINTSTKERQAKSLDLEQLFQSNKDEAAKAKELSTIFKAEYRAMAKTLNLSQPDELSRMDGEIDDMVYEALRLMGRTKIGEPALTVEEEERYFTIIQDIAEQIRPTSIKEVYFKIKHASEEGQKTIVIYNLDGSTNKKITIEHGLLPYSLIKPPGGDFIFSYGGTRGIIAPFQGLDDAYAAKGEKKKTFTHSKLLGVGQYGTVKAVEHLLTGLNQVVKKGNVPTNNKGSAFTPSSVSNPLTRPLTSRDDPLFRTESDILKSLSIAQKANGATGTIYWLDKDKVRPKGVLFTEAERPQYHILTEKAQGYTYADITNKELKNFPNSEIAYHDPCKRKEANPLASLKETLNLSMAIVDEAQKFAALDFAHNDIKPENFLYKKKTDGSYQVSFIDWATGGCKRKYLGKESTAEKIFEDVFGHNLKPVSANGRCTDAQGRFIDVNSKEYGINPTLQILHGARNGTLPYISPKVLGVNREAIPKAANEFAPKLDTQLMANDSTMDDWALTAMTFGICNRHSYFTLVKGRTVNDYAIPGILRADDKSPQGLEIIDIEKFNEFFACKNYKIKLADEVYKQKNAVMYIPANQREGEPLHLYRRLEVLLELLKKKPAYAQVDSEERLIATRVERILTLATQAVASGNGMNKKELQSQLAGAQDCLKSYELLNDPEHIKNLKKVEVLQAVFDQDRANPYTAMALLMKNANAISPLEILCTYPNTNEQEEKAIVILNRAFAREEVFNDIFVCGERDKKRPAIARYLFQKCIEQKQSRILISLLNKIESKNPPFSEIVRDDALLHYAAEKGMTEVFSALISALRRAGFNEAIMGLLLKEYGPGLGQSQTNVPIKWAANCFHIAIRNNNSTQLELMLGLWPKNQLLDYIIQKALHLCAVLGNKVLYRQIIDKFNQLHDAAPAEQIDTEKVLKMTFPPDGTSPYHLFLNEVSPEDPKKDVVPWDVLAENKNRALATKFLLTPPKDTSAYPLLLAAKSGNFTGVHHIIILGQTVAFDGNQWAEFFRQTDADGKNVFNYILEQKQLVELDALISFISKNCTEPASVFADLLSTPQPVNALTNYLKAEPDGEMQFKIVNQLFDAISVNFKEDKLQRIRLVTLLVNKEWLIDKANQQASQEQLVQSPLYTLLFDNEKLSIEFKIILLTELERLALAGSRAKEWFNVLLTPLKAKQPAVNPLVALELPVDIALAVAHQEKGINGLFKALVDQKMYAQANSELEERVALQAIEAERLRQLFASSQQQVATLTTELNYQIALAQQNEAIKIASNEEVAALTETLRKLEIHRAADIEQFKAAAAQKEKEHARLIDGQSKKAFNELEVLVHEHLAELGAAKKTASDIDLQLQRRTSELEQLQKSSNEQISTLSATLAQNDKTHAAALAGQIEQAKQALDAATATFKTERDSLQAALEAQNSNDQSGLKVTIADLTKRLTALSDSKDSEIRSLQDKIAGFKKLIEDCTRLNEQLLVDFDRHKSKSKKTEIALNQCLAELRERLDQQLVEVEAEYAVKSAVAASKDSEIIEDLRCRLKDALQAARATDSSAQTKINELTAALQTLFQKHEQSKRAFDEEFLRQKAAEEEIFSQFQGEYDAYKATSEHEKNELRNELQTLRGRLNDLQVVHQSTLVAQAENEAHLAHFSQLMEDHAHLQTTFQEFSKSNLASNEKTVQLKLKMDALVLQVTELETELQALRTSKVTQNTSDTNADETYDAEADDDTEESVSDAEIQTGANDTRLKTGTPIPAQVKDTQGWMKIKNKNSAILKEIMDEVAPLAEITKTLDSLSSTSMIWLNPAFQDSAKHYALGITDSLNELAKKTDLLIPYLKQQVIKLNNLLEAISDDEALRNQQEVSEQRALLKQSLEEVENYRNTQIRLQQQLKGNKNKTALLEKQGVLKTVEQALAEKKDLRQTSNLYTIAYEDYPLADKENYLAGLPKNAKLNSMEVSLPKEHYQTVDRVETGYFRVHKLFANNRELGQFIEERPTIDGIGYNAKTNLKLSIVSFPDAAHHEDRITYSVAIILQLLASLKAAPTPKKPIVLKGDNLEELHFLWTTLMLMSTQTGIGFDRQSIRVNNNTFDPKMEFDETTGRYSATSYYKKYFETSTKLNALMSYAKALMTDKFGDQNERQNVQATSARAIGLFNGKMGDVFRKIQENGNESGLAV